MIPAVFEHHHLSVQRCNHNQTTKLPTIVLSIMQTKQNFSYLAHRIVAVAVNADQQMSYCKDLAPSASYLTASWHEAGNQTAA